MSEEEEECLHERKCRSDHREIIKRRKKKKNSKCRLSNTEL